MMKIFVNNKRAVSVLEYMFFTTLVLFILLSFQKYLLNGINGMWKQAGDSFAFGRQYDANTTVECVYDMVLKNWYDDACLESYRCVVGDDNACRREAIRACVRERDDCDGEL